MARTSASLPGGLRLSDYLSVGVIARVFPRVAVLEALLLRSKTPALVLQELDGLMLAHYAVRCLIHEAAARAGQDPDRLSFLHAVNVVRRRIVHPGAFPPTARADER